MRWLELEELQRFYKLGIVFELFPELCEKFALVWCKRARVPGTARSPVEDTLTMVEKVA